MKAYAKYSLLALAALLVVSLIVCSGFSIPSLAANLVQNPGFETGSASPWNAWGGSSVVSNNARSGSYAGRTCTGSGECGFEQVVTVSPNTTYTLRGWARLTNAGDQASIGVKNYGGTETSDMITSTSYEEGVAEFTTGASNTTATIYCYRYPGGADYVYCDDFEVDLSTPAPTDTPVPTDTPGGPTDTPSPAGTCYVDCSAGTNGDGSQSSPWNTLGSVNATTFPAGSTILFKRGTTCNGQLYPKGSGASGSPNVVDAYGTGDLPIIAGGGIPDAVYLYNQEYWELHNVEVTNQGASAANRRGIKIVLEDFGTGSHYRLINVTIRDVNGLDQKDASGSAGIMFSVVGTSTQTRFDDVLVDGCTIRDVHRTGLNHFSSWNDRPELRDGGGPWYPGTNIVVRNTLAYNIGGDGIVPHHSDGSLLEYNVVHDFNVQSTNANVALWCWNCDNALMQFNEFYHGGWNGNLKDSQGMDFDGGNLGNVYQYNYSHENKGGMILICGYEVTDNNTLRYNISQNDGDQIIHVGCDNATDTFIYNNTVYVGNPVQTPAKVIHVDPSWLGANGSGAYFYNNIFHATGSGVSYDIPSNHQATFDYNVFYGIQPPSQVNDPHKLTSDPLLVDPGSGGTGLGSAGGYQLQSGSPCIDSGADLVTLGVVDDVGSQDYFGNAIPQNGVFDRGAHESDGSPPPPTNTPAPTDTPAPPTDTPIPPTDTPVPPTDTPEPGPTDTPVPPTDTPVPPTDTPIPPTDTPEPTATPGGGGNLALGRPATASSIDGSYVPANAVDGSLGTQWRSKTKSSLPSEWIKVDLGSVTTVSQVILKWGGRYATAYTIQVSTNDADWTTVYATSSGNGGTDDISFAAASARYVMMDSTGWTHTNFRCHLEEFEVYQ